MGSIGLLEPAIVYTLKHLCVIDLGFILFCRQIQQLLWLVLVGFTFNVGFIFLSGFVMRSTLVMWVMKFKHVLDQRAFCGMQCIFGQGEVFEM